MIKRKVKTKNKRIKNPYRTKKSIEYQYGYLQNLFSILTQFKYSKRPKDLVNNIITNSRNYNDDWLSGYNDGGLEAVKYYTENGIKKTLNYAKEIKSQLENFKANNNLK
jgi:hypothetical protein